MRKFQHLLSLLAAGMFLTVPAMAQTQSIKLTSAKPVGESISFSVNQLKHGVTVDWGDGVLQEIPASTDPVLKIEGTIKGNTIVISADRRLNALICPGQEVTSIDLSEVPNLISLYCQNNKLTELDITVCPILRDLNCADNQITHMLIDATKNKFIENLNIANNGMQNVKLTGTGPFVYRLNTLRTADISGNAFNAGSFGNNSNLDMLVSCNNSHSGKLDLKLSPSITSIVCSGNKYQQLLVPTTGYPQLRQLVMDDNTLETLDLSLCPELKVISVANNQLTDVALHEDVALYSYNCEGNKLNFSTLPGKAIKERITHFNYANQDPIIDITSVLKQNGENYYINLCQWADRNKSENWLDLRAYAKNAEGTKLTFGYYGRKAGETEFSEMKLKKLSSQEGDYSIQASTGQNAGASSFFNPFEEAYVEITYPAAYPGLAFTTTHFAIIDPSTGIADVTVNGKDGLALQPGKGSVTLQSAQPQMVNVYDAAGRRVVRMSVHGTETISLPSGIYVINGKKVAL
ncbi:MAG: hypothetical protein ACI3YC_04595 [Alloprevotella sp.]